MGGKAQISPFLVYYMKNVISKSHYKLVQQNWNKRKNDLTRKLKQKGRQSESKFYGGVYIQQLKPLYKHSSSFTANDMALIQTTKHIIHHANVYRYGTPQYGMYTQKYGGKE